MVRKEREQGSVNDKERKMELQDLKETKKLERRLEKGTTSEKGTSGTIEEKEKDPTQSKVKKVFGKDLGYEDLTAEN